MMAAAIESRNRSLVRLNFNGNPIGNDGGMAVAEFLEVSRALQCQKGLNASLQGCRFPSPVRPDTTPRLLPSSQGGHSVHFPVGAVVANAT